MITVTEFLATEGAKKFPSWMKDRSQWPRQETIEKVFPSFGLINCRESCSEDIVDYGETNSIYNSGLLGTPKIVKMDIVFSSDPWDIATMSMRGVLSCRHWDNPHSTSIIHEICSPNIGIVYLTDGTTTEYGESINKRCLVRYESYIMPGGASFIYLDRLYTKSKNKDPFQYVNTDPDSPKIKEIFKTFLKNKLNNKARSHIAFR